MLSSIQSQTMTQISHLESQPSTLSSKAESQWAQLQQYTQTHSEAYLLRFWVKQVSREQADENSRFQNLFDKMKKNLFGSTQFFPASSVPSIADDYIRAEKCLRDFDLMLFWERLCNDQPYLNLSRFDTADQIRTYLEDPVNQEKLATISSLCLPGIAEIWPVLHLEYGATHQLPPFTTERAMHNYLENPQNRATIGAILSQKREWILSKTTRLPPEIKYFINLEELIFSNRKGVVLPKEVFELKQLKILKVCHAELEKLSKKIGQLAQLQELTLIGTQFSQLPDSLLTLQTTKITIENKTEMKLANAMQAFLLHTL